MSPSSLLLSEAAAKLRSSSRLWSTTEILLDTCWRMLNFDGRNLTFFFRNSTYKKFKLNNRFAIDNSPLWMACIKTAFYQSAPVIIVVFWRNTIFFRKLEFFASDKMNMAFWSECKWIWMTFLMASRKINYLTNPPSFIISNKLYLFFIMLGYFPNVFDQRIIFKEAKL